MLYLDQVRQTAMYGLDMYVASWVRVRARPGAEGSQLQPATQTRARAASYSNQQSTNSQPACLLSGWGVQQISLLHVRVGRGGGGAVMVEGGGGGYHDWQGDMAVGRGRGVTGGGGGGGGGGKGGGGGGGGWKGV